MKLQLIDNFKNSVYSPEFYRSLESKPISFSVKYFFKLALVFVIVLTTIISFELIPRVNFFLNKLGPELLSSIPEDVEVKITGGRATSNLVEPFSIPMPPSFLSTQEELGIEIPTNLLVVNTQSPFESDKFDSYDTLLLLASDTFVRGEENEIQVIKLDSLGDQTITKPFLASLLNKVPVFLKWLSPIVIVVMFLGIFAVFMVNLAYALAVAFVIFIFGKIKKVPIRFKKSYQFAIHAISLPILISFAGYLFFPKVGSNVFLFIILSGLIAWVNIFKDQKPAQSIS
ncbi:MAG: Uncharacterized protein G01um101420_828 [Parcubacteria group bacterium Gr01-1014_20]|nr:MAG: Uncharacterized protein G01um101420_828 [Parcubacteria group bacterium Gr01-1014_20]